VTSTRAQSKGKRKREAKTIILENPSLHCKGLGTAYQKRNLFLKSKFSNESNFVARILQKES
jgi:hypothetical protein